MADKPMADKPKLNACPKGTRDLWPLLRLTTDELVAAVNDGSCDEVLAELAEMAAAHPIKSDTGWEKRSSVLDACRARLRAR